MTHDERPLRVLILSQYYWPEPVMIPSLLAEELHRRGHAVQVLTTFPHYPSGQLAPGYAQRRHQVEDVRGVRVHRVPMLVDRSESTARRALSYASFAGSSALWRRLAAAADVVYVYATQMTPAFGPMLWRATGGPPFVLHVQDLWPDSVVGSSFVGGGAGRGIAAALHPALRATYARAAATIGISESMTAALVDRGADPARARTVLNWGWEQDAPLARRSDMRERTSRRFLYAGNLGDHQRLDEVLRAAHLLRDDPRFSLDLYGSGGAETRLRALADELGLTSVRFHGRVQSEAMPAIYRDHDFQVVSLAPDAALQMAVPSKLQSSLLHALPVVVAAQGEAARLVERSSTGVVARALDAEGIAAAFREAMALDADAVESMSARARETYEQTMSLAAGVSAIESVLIEAARKGRSR